MSNESKYTVWQHNAHNHLTVCRRGLTRQAAWELVKSLRSNTEIGTRTAVIGVGRNRYQTVGGMALYIEELTCAGWRAEPTRVHQGCSRALKAFYLLGVAYP